MSLLNMFQAYFIIMTVYSTIRLSKDFKYYSVIYSYLPKMKFCRINGSVISVPDAKFFVPFLWDPVKNHFVLYHDVYLINHVLTCFSPYSLYWLLKYQIWFKKNVKVEELKDHNTILREKLSSLNLTRDSE